MDLVCLGLRGTKNTREVEVNFRPQCTQETVLTFSEIVSVFPTSKRIQLGTQGDACRSREKQGRQVARTWTGTEKWASRVF